MLFGILCKILKKNSGILHGFNVIRTNGKDKEGNPLITLEYYGKYYNVVLSALEDNPSDKKIIPYVGETQDEAYHDLPL
jgi:hypothetical protein